MKILITGGAGFIGSHLADYLIQRGDEIIIFDDLSTGRIENVEHLEAHSEVKFVHASVLDQDQVEETLTGVELVYHLAAAVGVNLIIQKPLESLLTNIRGTENVVESAYRHGARILITSTSEIYGKNNSDSLGEEDDRILGSPLKSRWSYSEAKAIDEILAYTYHKEMGLESIIVRLFNTVGPRQTGTYGMVIPRFVKQALSNKPITVYGDGSQTRCFCSVTDVVKGITALADHPEALGQVFNIGGTEEIAMSELAQKVVTLTESSSTIEHIPYDEVYEEGFEDMPRRVPNIAKAKNLVDFDPSTTLDEIIQAVIRDQKSG